MTIYNNSRYVGQSAVRRLFRGGLRSTLSLRDVDRTLGTGYVAYTIKDGDRLHNIAYDHWQHDVKTPEDFWWLIADKNPHIDPLKLEPGVVIWIPPASLVRSVMEGTVVST
jgi:hypothetical protein